MIRDLKFRGANEPPTFRIFVPWNQQPGGGGMAILVKTSGDPRDLAPDVSAIARDLRPGTGIQRARTLEDRLAGLKALRLRTLTSRSNPRTFGPFVSH